MKIFAPQVAASHYRFGQYMGKKRWMSIWHQLDEVSKLEPNSILEIGLGNGIFSAAAKALGLNVSTLDLDPELEPDYLGSADNLPFEDGTFDVVCAFQVLEHLPFDQSIKALSEMLRTATRAVVISLPDAKTSYAYTIPIPKFGTLRFHLINPLFKPRENKFDGQHHWELNKSGFLLDDVIVKFKSISPEWRLSTYRVHENTYHRFFLFHKISSQ